MTLTSSRAVSSHTRTHGRNFQIGHVYSNHMLSSIAAMTGNAQDVVVAVLVVMTVVSTVTAGLFSISVIDQSTLSFVLVFISICQGIPLLVIGWRIVQAVEESRQSLKLLTTMVQSVLDHSRASSNAETVRSEPLTRGELGGREYWLFSDGSIGLQTLLGPRRFPSLADARQFVGM